MGLRLDILVLLSGIVAYFAFVPKIPQDPAYHDFADKRTIFDIPNFWDVMSNTIFVVVGGNGFLSTDIDIIGYFQKRHFLPLAFFSSVIWTAFGSGYYHYNPSNETLVWDRLPMSVAFMSLLGIILKNKTSKSTKLFSNFIVQVVLVLIGVISVVWWAIFDNLKLYIAVQFGSMAYVIYTLYQNRQNLNDKNYRYLFLAIMWYIVAKVLELFDNQVFFLTFSVFSGHTLKHVTAGIGALYSGFYVTESYKKQHQ